MRLGEDFDLYARSLASGARLLLVPARGYVSVMRPNSLSVHHSEEDLLHLRESDRALGENLLLAKPDKHAIYQHYLSSDCRLQWRRLISAVKNRDARAAIGTFLRPWPVPLYLTKQLAMQAYLRTFRRAL